MSPAEATTGNPALPPPRLPIGHILVPLDGSALGEGVLPLATTLARGFSARITLLRVLETEGPIAGSGHVDPLQWEMLRAEAQEYLAGLEKKLAGGGIEVSVAIVQGRPAEQILHFLLHREVDLVVLSSHGERGLTGWSLSSNAHKVAARAGTSVLLVPAYERPELPLHGVELERILVPLDCSQRAEHVLRLATELAAAHDAELILAHVVPVPETPRRMPPSAEDLALVEQLTQRNRSAAEHYLEELEARLRAEGIRATRRVLVSPRAASAVRELAVREKVDLIFLSAHGATADCADRYGRVATRLLQEGDRPIFILQDLPDSARHPSRAERAAASHPGH